MSERKAISKRLRFEIFKRDNFTCQYCGKCPPAVILEIDHITPVLEGGTNDDHNLLAACFDCNRGKGKIPLDAPIPTTAERAAMLEERMEQARAYDALLQDRRQLEEVAIEDAVAVYEIAFEGYTLTDGARQSIRKFLRQLPATEVYEAMEMATTRCNSNRAFKYFCGICWNKIKGGER